MGICFNFVSFREKVGAVNRYMTQKGVDPETQMRIRHYLEHAWSLDNSELGSETEFMNVLSKPLRESIISQMNENVLRHCSLLNSNFSPRFVRELSFLMKEIKFSPDEIIIDADKEYDDKAFYIITKGDIEVSVGATGTHLKTLSKGSWFGEYSFFTNQHYWSNFTCVTFSTVHHVKRSEFLNLLQKFPVDKEKFCQIRDNMMLYDNYSVLKLKCMICEKQDHLTEKCSYTHYIPDQTKLPLLRIPTRIKLAQVTRDRGPEKYFTLGNYKASEKSESAEEESKNSSEQSEENIPATPPSGTGRKNPTTRSHRVEIASTHNLEPPLERKPMAQAVAEKSILKRRESRVPFRGDVKHQFENDNRNANWFAAYYNSQKASRQRRSMRRQRLSSSDSISLESDEEIKDDYETCSNFRLYFPHNNLTSIHPQQKKANTKGILSFFKGIKAQLDREANELPTKQAISHSHHPPPKKDITTLPVEKPHRYSPVPPEQKLDLSMMNSSRDLILLSPDK